MDPTTDGKPPRPGMPLLLPCALGFWAVAAATYAAGRDAETAGLIAAIGGGLALALGGIVGLAILSRRCVRAAVPMALSLGLGCALGCACGCVGALSMQADARSVVAAEDPWRCELVSDAKEGAFSTTAQALVHGGEGRPFKVRLDFDGESGLDATALTAGTVLRAELSLSAPRQKEAEFLWGQGICATAKVRIAEELPREGAVGTIVSLRERAIALIAAFGGAQADVLAALVCGYRVPLEDSGAYERYKTAGLAHVVAVSGAHLAIVTATFGSALRLLRVPRKGQLIVLAAFVLAYVVFAGVPLSAVRAAFMVLLMLAGQVARRRSASLNALALCIIVFVALDPPTAVSVSFFLSCGSTLGIVLFAPLFSWWLAFLPKLLRRSVGDPLALTFASNMVSLPFSAALFSQIPLVAPVANVVAAPLFSLGCVFGLMATLLSCSIPALAAPLIALASSALWPLAAITTFFAELPYACIPAALPLVPMIGASVLAVVGLWAWWPSLSLCALGVSGAAMISLLLGALFLWPKLEGPSIVMLDVGQGDAFLVRGGGHSVLIDTGNQDAKLRRALGRQRAFALDAVVITHGDDDHCGSLDQLASVTDVRRVLVARDALDCACDACDSLREEATAAVGEGGVIGLSVGDRIAVGPFELRVLWPRSFADEGGNADSLCLLATLDADGDGAVDWRALFCGDAEAEQLQRLVDEGVLGVVDVLKVGHHGSRASLTPELLAALRPRVALIGVGANNRYGHPTEETLRWLEEADVATFRSDSRGDVALSFTAQRMTVECAVQ